MKNKLLKSIVIISLLCIATICSIVAFAGCDANSAFGGKSSWKFKYVEFNTTAIASDAYFYQWDDGTEGYILEIDAESTARTKISKIENIPTEYNGKPVVMIDFHGTAITDLVVPEGIKYVALGGCKSLKNVTLPNTLRALTENNFYSCTSLESITIPESVVGIGPLAFASCENLKEIKMPASLTDIYISAFSSPYQVPMSSTYTSARLK